MKYHLMTPDGYPITVKPFASKAAAKAYIPRYCKELKWQGFNSYLIVEREIPLSELPQHLRIVEA